MLFKIKILRYFCLIFAIFFGAVIAYCNQSSILSIIFLSALVAFFGSLVFEFFISDFSCQILMLILLSLTFPWVVMYLVGSQLSYASYGSSAIVGLVFVFVCIPINVLGFGLLLYHDFFLRKRLKQG